MLFRVWIFIVSIEICLMTVVIWAPIKPFHLTCILAHVHLKETNKKKFMDLEGTTLPWSSLHSTVCGAPLQDTHWYYHSYVGPFHPNSCRSNFIQNFLRWKTIPNSNAHWILSIESYHRGIALELDIHVSNKNIRNQDKLDTQKPLWRFG